MRYRHIIAVIIPSALLGCGSGGVSSGSVSLDPTFAVSSADTITSVLDGDEILADAVVARHDLVNGGNTTEAVQTVYSYDRATEILTMRIGGKTRSLDLTGTDPNINITPDAATELPGTAGYGIFVQSDDLQDFVDWTASCAYLIPIRSFYPEDRNIDVLRSFGVVGLRTPVAAVNARSDVASYGGGFLVGNYTAGTATINDRVTYFGTMNATVDFGAGQLSSGALDVTLEQLGNDPTTAATGSLTLSSAPLTNGGFTTGLRSGVAGLTIQPGSTVSGRFYGPNAQEVGGTITYDATLNSQQVQGFGFSSGS